MDSQSDSISTDLSIAAGAGGLLLLGMVAAVFVRQALAPAIHEGDLPGVVRALAGFAAALGAVGVVIAAGLDAVGRVWGLFAQNPRFQRDLAVLAQGGPRKTTRIAGRRAAEDLWCAVRPSGSRLLLGLLLLGCTGWLFG
jgi:hypothetical protein